MTQTVHDLSIDETTSHQLTAVDRCDSCGAQAYIAAEVNGSELLFCAHHGRKYEEKLREELSGWVGKARRVGGRRTRGTASGSRASSNDSSRIREWAREAGYEVPDRGRISGAIRKAYEEAHGE